MDNERNTILLVDDEKSIRDTLKIVLQDSGYNVIAAEDGNEALKCISENVVDILITDLRMPKMDGIELMKRVLDIEPFVEVIFISAYSDIKCAVEAIKMGAFDYIQKSFSTEELLITVGRAVERKKLIEENNILRMELKKDYLYDGVIGKSPKMQVLFSRVSRIANSNATVLLTGESGVGKEVFARLIHNRSPRKDKDFVIVNCAAIPESLFESELFGHEKGSFTGAIYSKVGKFEQANGGTIFLDEIGELPLSMQVKLLRVLQERQFERIGSLNSINIDIRIIAATNKDLLKEVKLGNFREDLFYRLNVVNLNIPSLRERKEDICLLAESFLEEFSAAYNKKLKFIDMETMNILYDYPWKGNVRELRNSIESSVVMAGDNEEILLKRHLPPQLIGEVELSDNERGSQMTLKDYEKLIIRNTLKKVNGNKTKAAELLDIKRQTLYNKIKEYGLSD